MKCAVCGKEFERTDEWCHFKFCSEECLKKGRKAVFNKAMRKRYAEDEEFRNARIRKNIESNRRRREARREQVMQELIVDLMQADTSDEVRKILEEKTRIKSKFYA